MSRPLTFFNSSDTTLKCITIDSPPLQGTHAAVFPVN